MFVLVLAAEADETRQAITFLIVCLVGVAVLLTALTVWYWIITSPRHRANLLMGEPGHLDDQTAGSRPEPQRETVLVGVGVGVNGMAAAADSEDQPLIPPRPAILSESSELMSSTLAGSDHDSPIVPVPPSPPVQPPPRRIEIAERRSEPDRPARLTGAIARPAATEVPNPGPRTVASSRPVAVTPRMGLGDERARARGRATRKVRSAPGPDGPRHAGPRQDAKVTARPVSRVASEPVSRLRPGSAGANQAAAARRADALSDEDWASIMKSAFEQLNR